VPASLLFSNYIRMTERSPIDDVCISEGMRISYVYVK
jgi:hypothetical protein